MPNNFLDKLTWNFIHERQTVDGSDYVKSIITKLEVILSKNVSHSVRSNLKTALEDLKKVNFNVTKLKETVKDLESENKKLKTKLEKLEAKSKSTKEE
jgi:predicted RNase H-like nuclease (RuvC/YqgF family)